MPQCIVGLRRHVSRLESKTSAQCWSVGIGTARNMLKISAKDKGLYRDRLRPDAKRRYFEKIACIGNVDPYEIRKWSGNPDDLPPLSYPDIFAYLVCGVSAYTANQFKNFKSLEAHIQFTNGWVQALSVFKPPRCECVVVKT
ncbi:unnamed protein product [Oreochromis niloticus]|nr:unnamed protein product [Mustela putorius furo]